MTLTDLRTVMVSAGFAFCGTQSCREACTESLTCKYLATAAAVEDQTCQLLAPGKRTEPLLVLSDSIQAIWQQGNRKQRVALLDQLVRVLQSISEEEAQAIPDKDPERPGLYDQICNTLYCCGP